MYTLIYTNNANVAYREISPLTLKMQSISVTRIIMLIKNLLYLRSTQSTQRCMPASNRVKLLVERRKLG